jgi:hypothetical protein
MEQVIVTEVKELEKLFCWYEFYSENNNEIEANKCQKQIEEKKRYLKHLKQTRRGKIK